MSEETNPLKGKVVNPISETIKVVKLDWSKLNIELNEYLHERFPERKDDSWYFEDRYCGLIEKNGIYIILTKEAIFMLPEIFDVKKGVIGFRVGVYKDLSKENAQSIIPDWNFQLPAEEIVKIKTDVVVSLPDFMWRRYKYNPRISSNELNLIKYLQEETNYFAGKKNK